MTKTLKNFPITNIFRNELLEYRYSALIERVAFSSLDEIKKYYYKLHETKEKESEIKIKENAPWSKNYINDDAVCCVECDLLKYAIQHCIKKNINSDFKKWFPNM